MSVIADVQHAGVRLGTGFGFAVVLLGMLCLMTPFFAGVAVNTLLAITVGAAGLTMTVYAFKAGKFGKGALQFLFGGITILAALAMLAHPVLGVLSMTVVLIAWFIADGVMGIVAGIQAKGAPGWGWVIVSGVASLLLGALLWAQWPASGVYAVGLLAGIRLVFSGWSIAMLGLVGDAVVEAAEEQADQFVAAATDNDPSQSPPSS